MSETLGACCGHLTSDHETTAAMTPELLAEIGTPCNRCNADPSKAMRAGNGMLCEGFREWPIDDIPYPGTIRAQLIGCACPVGVNIRRAVDKLPLVYEPSCVVHVWVCRLSTACEHADMLGPNGVWRVVHTRPHLACSHCTVPQITCDTCGKIWMDWRIEATRAGWVKIHDESPSLKSIWRCGTCQQ